MTENDTFAFDPEGNAASALGFSAVGVHAGFRADPERLDMALVVADEPCAAAATFTTNVFCAAPVRVSREHLNEGGAGSPAYGCARAVVVNSGIANAATGEIGLENARKTAELVGEAVGCPADEVLVASTGVIGQHLRLAPFAEGVPAALAAMAAAADDLAGRTSQGLTAARAIMTTDTCPKHGSVSFSGDGIGYPGVTFTVGGMCKGAGMIMPNMATMIAVITTDVPIAAPDLSQALTAAVNKSFNKVTVDSDTSTNDTCFALAYGRRCRCRRTHGGQFAAREDRRLRTRCQLGPCCRRPRTVRCSFQSGGRGYRYTGPARVPCRSGGRFRRRRGPAALRRTRSGHRGGSARGGGVGHDVDLRLLARVRDDQWRLSLMKYANEARAEGVPVRTGEILYEAMPWLKQVTGKTIVIKYGGSAMENPQLAAEVMADIVLLKILGVNPVLVHGGGKAINRAFAKFDLPVEFVDGQRVTTDDAMDLVRMVLTGEVNQQLVEAMNAHGNMGVGVSGTDAGIIVAEQADPRLGRVGKITRINTPLIEDLVADDYIPIIASIAIGEDGGCYNVNADVAAGYIAAAIGAHKIIFLTDVDGLYENYPDPDSLIAEMSLGEAEAMVRGDKLASGMIPKLASCVRALDSGVSAAHIINGTVPHALLLEMLTDSGMGTMVGGLASAQFLNVSPVSKFAAKLIENR